MSRMPTSQDRERIVAPRLLCIRSGAEQPLGVPPSKLVLTVGSATYHVIAHELPTLATPKTTPIKQAARSEELSGRSA
jgi:hypothetical protein